MVARTAFKIPNMEIDRDDPRHHAAWDEEKKVYTMQIFFSVRALWVLNSKMDVLSTWPSMLVSTYWERFVPSQHF